MVHGIAAAAVCRRIFIIYVWKVVVWDKVLGLGTTDALSGDMSQWAMAVVTAYFGGRTLEKVARVFAKK